MNLAVSVGVDRKVAGHPVSLASETSQKPHLPRSGYIYIYGVSAVPRPPLF